MTDVSRAEVIADEELSAGDLLGYPEIAVIADGIELGVEPVASSRRCTVAPNRVTLDSRLDEPAARAILHFALELALWSRLDWRAGAVAQSARLLAAAQATAALPELLAEKDAAAMRQSLPAWLGRLIAAAMAPTLPIDLGRVLADCAAFIDGACDPSAAWEAFLELRPVALPAAALMLQHGDNRLDLDPANGLNKYGCSPLPRAGVVGLSSCTASDISMTALRAAEGLRREMMEAAARGDRACARAAIAARLRRSLLESCGLSPREGVLPILAASGTTAMLIAAHIGRAGRAGIPLALLVGAEETGRGVPLSAAGCHSAPCTPTGDLVAAGRTVEGYPAGYEVERIPLRGGDGVPHRAEYLRERIAAAIDAAEAAGRAVILHVPEGSKTGLAAPGLPCVLELIGRYQDLVVVVDACQMRTDMARLRAYLAAGCMVALTGSKFMGGPAFSGALLVPAALARRSAPLPSGLAAYSWRGDWTEEWPGSLDGLAEEGNPGLLLRWQGALAEMAALASLPVGRASAILAEFAAAVREAIADRPECALLPTASEGADEPPSIFGIAVRDPRSGAWLDEAALRRLYVRLGEDFSSELAARWGTEGRRLAGLVCQVGQPVVLAGGAVPAVLRLAAGARTIVAAARPGGIEIMRRQIADTVAKLRLLLSLD